MDARVVLSHCATLARGLNKKKKKRKEKKKRKKKPCKIVSEFLRLIMKTAASF